MAAVPYPWMNSRRPLRLVLALASLLALGRPLLALPAEVTIKGTTKMELMRDERVTGSIMLKGGEQLDLIDVTEKFAIVRYRNVNGRVPLANTDLPPSAETPPAAAAPVAEIAPPPAPPTLPPKPVAPASRIERALAGKMVAMQSGKLAPFGVERLAGVKFYALYFSASWCGPCREFTPSLVAAYPKLRAEFPEFEIILVNADHSASDMARYIKDDKMAWPSLGWSAAQSSELRAYCGEGIPCLVLVAADGRVLSDSFRGDDYVGPQTVLKDTWRILADYRKKNPKPTS